jgi:hypothetical protein
MCRLLVWASAAAQLGTCNEEACTVLSHATGFAEACSMQHGLHMRPHLHMSSTCILICTRAPHAASSAHELCLCLRRPKAQAVASSSTKACAMCSPRRCSARACGACTRCAELWPLRLRLTCCWPLLAGQAGCAWAYGRAAGGPVHLYCFLSALKLAFIWSQAVYLMRMVPYCPPLVRLRPAPWPAGHLPATSLAEHKAKALILLPMSPAGRAAQPGEARACSRHQLVCV